MNYLNSLIDKPISIRNNYNKIEEICDILKEFNLKVNIQLTYYNLENQQVLYKFFCNKTSTDLKKLIFEKKFKINHYFLSYCKIFKLNLTDIELERKKLTSEQIKTIVFLFFSGLKYSTISKLYEISNNEVKNIIFDETSKYKDDNVFKDYSELYSLFLDFYDNLKKIEINFKNSNIHLNKISFLKLPKNLQHVYLQKIKECKEILIFFQDILTDDPRKELT